MIVPALDWARQAQWDWEEGVIQGLLCWPVVCRNCGLVRFHAPQVFRDSES